MLLSKNVCQSSAFLLILLLEQPCHSYRGAFPPQQGVKKAAKAKQICRGVKEVAKAIRKGAKGVVIIAGDISPIDVITHVPVMCEEADVRNLSIYLYPLYRTPMLQLVQGGR